MLSRALRRPDPDPDPDPLAPVSFKEYTERFRPDAEFLRQRLANAPREFDVMRLASADPAMQNRDIATASYEGMSDEQKLAELKTLGLIGTQVAFPVTSVPIGLYDVYQGAREMGETDFESGKLRTALGIAGTAFGIPDAARLGGAVTRGLDAMGDAGHLVNPLGDAAAQRPRIMWEKAPREVREEYFASLTAPEYVPGQATDLTSQSPEFLERLARGNAPAPAVGAADDVIARVRGGRVEPEAPVLEGAPAVHTTERWQPTSRGVFDRSVPDIQGTRPSDPRLRPPSDEEFGGKVSELIDAMMNSRTIPKALDKEIEIGMTRGGPEWYNLGPIKASIEETPGSMSFEDFNATGAASSIRNTVPNEIGTQSVINYALKRGISLDEAKAEYARRFGKKPQIMGSHYNTAVRGIEEGANLPVDPADSAWKVPSYGDKRMGGGSVMDPAEAGGMPALDSQERAALIQAVLDNPRLAKVARKTNSLADYHSGVLPINNVRDYQALSELYGDAARRFDMPTTGAAQASRWLGGKFLRPDAGTAPQGDFVQLMEDQLLHTQKALGGDTSPAGLRKLWEDFLRRDAMLKSGNPAERGAALPEIVNPVGRAAVGGTGGALTGGQVGDTPEERRRNALIGLGLGAAGGAALPSIARYLDEMGEAGHLVNPLDPHGVGNVPYGAANPLNKLTETVGLTDSEADALSAYLKENYSVTASPAMLKANPQDWINEISAMNATSAKANAFGGPPGLNAMDNSWELGPGPQPKSVEPDWKKLQDALDPDNYPYKGGQPNPHFQLRSGYFDHDPPAGYAGEPPRLVQRLLEDRPSGIEREDLQPFFYPDLDKARDELVGLGKMYGREVGGPQPPITNDEIFAAREYLTRLNNESIAHIPEDLSLHRGGKFNTYEDHVSLTHDPEVARNFARERGEDVRQFNLRKQDVVMDFDALARRLNRNPLWHESEVVVPRTSVQSPLFLPRETAPSRSSGHMSGVQRLSPEDELDYGIELGFQAGEDRGYDPLFMALGVKNMRPLEATGYFRDAPDAPLQTNSSLVARVTDGDWRYTPEGNDSRIIAGEGLMGLARAQDAVAGYRIEPFAKADAATSMFIPLTRKITREEMDALDKLVSPHGFALSDSGQGLALINVSGKSADDVAALLDSGLDEEVSLILREAPGKLRPVGLSGGRLRDQGMYEPILEGTTPGQGEAVRRVQALMDRAPDAELDLGNDRLLRGRVERAGLKDEHLGQVNPEVYGVPREDIQNFRRIYGEGGWEAIKEALARGVPLPAIMAALNGTDEQ